MRWNDLPGLRTYALSALAGFCILCPALAAPVLARGAPDSFAELSAKLLPTVVNISTTAIVKADPAEVPDETGGSVPYDLFKNFLKNNKSSPRRVAALGSGFVIDPAGLIVTNEHVIDGADTITVTFNDGSSLPATLVGRDDKTDLALVRVHPRAPLAAAHFGDSDKALVGDWVVAIGDPFGLGSSVTAGIVSARNRDISAGPYDDFIQTDAPINRGNSGGPLFDMDGNVIGIASAIYSPSGGSVGVGFAIPSNMARGVVAQLSTFGRARHGWIGIRVQAVTQEIADSLGLPSQGGALVADVTSDGPGAHAGLKSGDVITAYNKNSLPDSRALSRLVAQTPIGSSVPVEVLRNGQKRSLSLTIAQLDDAVGQGGAARTSDIAPPKVVTGFAELGVALAPADLRLRTKYQLGDATEGVVVTNVAPDSPAAEQDMRAGDVILEVQNMTVHSPQDVSRHVDASANAGRKAVLFRVRREGQSNYVALRLGGAE